MTGVLWPALARKWENCKTIGHQFQMKGNENDKSE